jgi:hypothetical protein
VKNISLRAKSALFCCIAIGLSTAAIANPGDLDTFFGTAGTSIFSPGDTAYNLYPESVAVDRLNRVIVGTNFVGAAEIDVLTANGTSTADSVPPVGSRSVPRFARWP